eukprot:gene1332-377_t
MKRPKLPPGSNQAKKSKKMANDGDGQQNQIQNDGQNHAQNHRQNNNNNDGVAQMPPPWDVGSDPLVQIINCFKAYRMFLDLKLPPPDNSFLFPFVGPQSIRAAHNSSSYCVPFWVTHGIRDAMLAKPSSGWSGPGLPFVQGLGAGRSDYVDWSWPSVQLHFQNTKVYFENLFVGAAIKLEGRVRKVTGFDEHGVHTHENGSGPKYYEKDQFNRSGARLHYYNRKELSYAWVIAADQKTAFDAAGALAGIEKSHFDPKSGRSPKNYQPPASALRGLLLSDPDFCKNTNFNPFTPVCRFGQPYLIQEVYPLQQDFYPLQPTQ